MGCTFTSVTLFFSTSAKKSTRKIVSTYKRDVVYQFLYKEVCYEFSFCFSITQVLVLAVRYFEQHTHFWIRVICFNLIIYPR